MEDSTLTPGQLADPAEQDISRLDGTLRALAHCIEAAETKEGLTLGEAVDSLGASGFCFVSLLLATLFIQPISLGPLTMASGGVFMIVGWQMARGRAHIELPEKFRGWHLRGNGWIKVLKLCRRMLVWLAKFTKARMVDWVDGGRGTRNVGWLIFIGGLLLAIPCGNLPFNNTLPALMVFFAALAWLERDGLMAILSIVWGFLTLVYFAAAFTLLFWAGSSAWGWLKGWFA